MPGWRLQMESLLFTIHVTSMGCKLAIVEPHCKLWHRAMGILCQKTAIFCLTVDTDGPTPRTDHILGYVARNDVPRAPATPCFCGFHPSESPKRTPRPPY